MRATAALNVLLVEQVRPPLVPREVLGVTVAGYLDGWLERVRHDVRASTLVAYRNAVSHVVAGLGHVSLGSLAARQVQGWQRALLDERGLSSKTVANVHAVLHRALADAVRLELLDRNVPAMEFFDSLPAKVVAEFQAVLDAVADAPPPAFSGGGKWEAMHDEMAGFYEVRVQGAGMNHRLFCVLERAAGDLGGPSIVVIGGLSKPKRSPADPKDYRRALRWRAEFQTHRTVLE